MTKWTVGATEFKASIIHNIRRGTSYSYIPQPMLDKLGNSEGLQFVIRSNEILFTRPVWFRIVQIYVQSPSTVSSRASNLSSIFPYYIWWPTSGL